MPRKQGFPVHPRLSIPNVPIFCRLKVHWCWKVQSGLDDWMANEPVKNSTLVVCYIAEGGNCNTNLPFLFFYSGWSALLGWSSLLGWSPYNDDFFFGFLSSQVVAVARSPRWTGGILWQLWGMSPSSPYEKITGDVERSFTVGPWQG